MKSNQVLLCLSRHVDQGEVQRNDFVNFKEHIYEKFGYSLKTVLKGGEWKTRFCSSSVFDFLFLGEWGMRSQAETGSWKEGDAKEGRRKEKIKEGKS